MTDGLLDRAAMEEGEGGMLEGVVSGDTSDSMTSSLESDERGERSSSCGSKLFEDDIEAGRSSPSSSLNGMRSGT